MDPMIDYNKSAKELTHWMKSILKRDMAENLLECIADGKALYDLLAYFVPNKINEMDTTDINLLDYNYFLCIIKCSLLLGVDDEFIITQQRIKEGELSVVVPCFYHLISALMESVSPSILNLPEDILSAISNVCPSSADAVDCNKEEHSTLHRSTHVSENVDEEGRALAEENIAIVDRYEEDQDRKKKAALWGAIGIGALATIGGIAAVVANKKKDKD